MTKMNAKLEAISKKAAADLQGLIADSEEKILEAWNSVEEEAQTNETKPVFKLGLAITLSLDEDKMEVALTFGVRHKLSVDSAIPNPSQPDLGLKDSTVTITAEGHEPVTVSAETFSKFVNKKHPLP